MELVDLQGRNGLVVGIANDHSLAWSAARHFRSAGAEFGVTYLNDKAKPYVEPLAREVEAALFLPCDVARAGHLMPSSTPSRTGGAGWTSCSIRSPRRATRTCTGG